MSAPMASRVQAVSLRVSPLLALDPAADQFTTSAESIFSASSKETRVRVEFSKNRFTANFPRRAGTFLMGRDMRSSMCRACSSSNRISSRLHPSRPSTCRRVHRVALEDVPLTDDHLVLSVQFLQPHLHHLGLGGGQVLAHEIRLDRQFPMSPVDEDPPGAPWRDAPGP